MISRAADYAIRALTCMALAPDREYLGVRELAEVIDASRTYLGKVLQQLARRGFLKSTTGPRGGFGLAKSPDEIMVLDVMRALEDRFTEEKLCILGLADCSDQHPCPVHDVWKATRKELLESFRRTSIAQAAGKAWPDFKDRMKRSEHARTAGRESGNSPREKKFLPEIPSSHN